MNPALITVFTFSIFYIFYSSIFLFWWHKLAWEEDKHLPALTKWNILFSIIHTIIIPYMTWLLTNKLFDQIRPVNEYFALMIVVLVFLWFYPALLIIYASIISINILFNKIPLHYFRINYSVYFWLKNFKWAKTKFAKFYSQIFTLPIPPNQLSLKIVQTGSLYTCSVNIDRYYPLDDINFVFITNNLNNLVDWSLYKNVFELRNSTIKNVNFVYDQQAQRIYFAYGPYEQSIVTYDLPTGTNFSDLSSSNLVNLFNIFNQVRINFRCRDQDCLHYSKNDITKYFRSSYHFIHENYQDLNWSEIKLTNRGDKIIWQYQLAHNLQVYQQELEMVPTPPTEIVVVSDQANPTIVQSEQSETEVNQTETVVQNQGGSKCLLHD